MFQIGDKLRKTSGGRAYLGMVGEVVKILFPDDDIWRHYQLLYPDQPRSLRYALIAEKFLSWR